MTKPIPGIVMYLTDEDDRTLSLWIAPRPGKPMRAVVDDIILDQAEGRPCMLDLEIRPGSAFEQRGAL